MISDKQNIEKVLKDIYATYGAQIINEPKRLKSLLMDLSPVDSNEINILINANLC